jgi:putative transposase
MESPSPGDGHAEEQIYRRTDHRDPGRAGAGRANSGRLSQFERTEIARDFRENGLSTATFYKFKAKYGGMDITDARKLKLLEIENGRLKRMLADAMLDNTVLKDLLGKS